MHKVIMFFPYAATYRAPIYKLIDEEFNTEYHFCNTSHFNLPCMDYNDLKNCKFDLKEIVIHKEWVFYRGMNNFHIYKGDVLIMTSNVRNLSIWYEAIKLRIFKPSVKIIMWGHGAYGKESKLQYVVKKMMYSLCHKLLVYGDYSRNLIITNGLAPSDKVVTVYNSLDYDKQVQFRFMECKNIVAEHFGNDKQSLVFIGRLTAVKKLWMIIDAMSILKSQNKEYNLIFIGDGEEKMNLQKRAEELGLSNAIWFYGQCYDDKEMFPLLKYSDLCVAPGNVGLTAMHALTYGIPVITHNNFPYQMPEFEAIQDGFTGCFFTQDSIESLSESIQNWFDTHSDRNLVREECYKIIDRLWNPHNQLKIIKQVINELSNVNSEDTK